VRPGKIPSLAEQMRSAADGEDCLKLRSSCAGRSEFRSRADERLSAVEAKRLSRVGHRRTGPPPQTHIGHASSFHAISQNIHS
jgi:hypothetical protein